MYIEHDKLSKLFGESHDLNVIVYLKDQKVPIIIIR